jgi:hypothetical protein
VQALSPRGYDGTLTLSVILHRAGEACAQASVQRKGGSFQPWTLFPGSCLSHAWRKPSARQGAR